MFNDYIMNFEKFKQISNTIVADENAPMFFDRFYKNEMLQKQEVVF